MILPLGSDAVVIGNAVVRRRAQISDLRSDSGGAVANEADFAILVNPASSKRCHAVAVAKPAEALKSEGPPSPCFESEGYGGSAFA